MTDRLTSLLHAVLARPEDDLPRLVYADALEEAGERERAEFIRVQIALAKADYPIYGDTGGYESERSVLQRRSDKFLANGMDIPGQLLAQPRRDWSGPELAKIGNDDSGWARWDFERGFVSYVRCSISAWCGEECRICRSRTMVAVPYDSFNSTFRTYERCIACHGTGRTPGHGPEIVARHPVERVEITGLEPMPSGPGRGAVWYWIAGVLPAGLIPHMNQAVRENPDAYALGSHAAFPTREDALTALSAAAIRWARAEAVRRGLVPDVWGWGRAENNGDNIPASPGIRNHSDSRLTRF